ncbi:MAG: FG-GAP repeat protein, partial [Candidatus Eisenbacteria bacterium]|nr:FG-GAP repeat protein [Candidatus Eisenbacteria bacterium]
GDGYSDLLVGTPRYDSGQVDEGAVYLFYGGANGPSSSPDWMIEADLANAWLGYSISTAGDVNGDGYDDILVGSPHFELGDFAEGIALVFLGSASGPAHSADWYYQSNQASAYFGRSVAYLGDVNRDGYDDIAVGADRYSNGQSNEGRVYAFYGSAAGVPASPSWTAEVNQAGCGFGGSVSGAGDVNADGYPDLIVGASNYITGSTIGAAFLYHGSASGLTGPNRILFGDDDILFGECVAGAGDVDGDGYADVLVGAPNYNEGSTYTGKAYLYPGSSSGVAADPVWEYEGESTYAHFGAALGTAGDVNGDGYADVIVGSHEYTGSLEEEGVAYVFYGYHTGLSPEPVWRTEGNIEFASYGTSVATAGDLNGDGFSDLVVGAPYVTNGQAGEGRVYVYFGSGDGPRTTAGWVTESNAANTQYGYSVAGAGDINGDGFDDVLVGASNFDNGQIFEGAAFLFLGSELGLNAIPSWYAEGEQEYASFGRSVAGAGDVNGDGLEDILIGADNYTQTESREGAAFLWHGSVTGVPAGGPVGSPATADWAAYGGQEEAGFGFAIASAGDVDGDGLADVIVGAYAYDNGQIDEGAAFVYLGSDDGLEETPQWFHDCDHANAYYGVSVGSAGDFNGDGLSDVIVGAIRYDHPTAGEGAAFVYLGSSAGVLPGAPYWYAESNEENGNLGYSVAGAGDINGDGIGDVVVGAPEMDAPAVDGGRAFVWYGGSPAPPNGNPTNAAWSAGRNELGAWFGRSVASAGDLDNDGYGDIIIGAPLDTAPGSPYEAEGTAFVYLGSADGIGVGPADWYGSGGNDGSRYGWAVACAGDVNGDGASDLIVGAHRANHGQVDEGRAYLYYGNGSRGLARLPRQWQTDLSRPIAPLGRSNEPDEFGVLARLRSPEGRGMARLVTEVESYANSFDGVGTAAGAWRRTSVPTTNGGSYVVEGQVLPGLASGGLYKWRLRFESKNPLFPRSPWLHLSANGETEADVRMFGTPSYVENEPGEEGTNASDALRLALSRTSPNPFRSETSVTWRLPAASDVQLTVHDVGGRRIRTLVSEARDAGVWTTEWNGRDEEGRPVPAGIYWLRLSTKSETARMKLVRLD